jgi:hypothetical protein
MSPTFNGDRAANQSAGYPRQAIDIMDGGNASVVLLVIMYAEVISAFCTLIKLVVQRYCVITNLCWA